MQDLLIPAADPPVFARVVASHWAETLRQTACLEVLLDTQALLLAHLTGQPADEARQQSRAQVEAVLHRLLRQYGYGPLLEPAAKAAPTKAAPSAESPPAAPPELQPAPPAAAEREEDGLDFTAP